MKPDAKALVSRLPQHGQKWEVRDKMGRSVLSGTQEFLALAR